MKKIIFSFIAVALLTACGGQKNENATESKSDNDVAVKRDLENNVAVADVNPADLKAKAAEDFFRNLDANASIVKTSSGLRYKIVKDAQGEKPTPTSTVVVDYRGTFTNGKEFDGGQDVAFPLNRVIPGFSEGIGLMSPGAEYILYIPSDLAYGESGAGDVIPPNTPIIFEVKLKEIK